MLTFFSDYSLLYKSMFPRDRLVFGKDLGTGWFGKVSSYSVYNNNLYGRRSVYLSAYDDCLPASCI